MTHHLYTTSRKLYPILHACDAKPKTLARQIDVSFLHLSNTPHTPSLLITMPFFPKMPSNVYTPFYPLFWYVLVLPTRYVPASPPCLCKSISLNDAHSPCVSLPKPLILSAVYFMNNVPHYLRALPTPGIFIIPALSSYFIRNSY